MARKGKTKEKQRLRQEWPMGSSLNSEASPRRNVFHTNFENKNPERANDENLRFYSESLDKKISNEIETEFSNFSNHSESLQGKGIKARANLFYGNTSVPYRESIGGNPEDDYSLTKMNKQ